MKEGFTDMDWIEHYLDRSLNEGEVKWMEQRLAEEPEFQARLKEHKLLIEGIRYAHLHDKLIQLRTLEKKLPAIKGEPEGKQVMLNWWKPAAIAASMALLVTTYLLINQAPDTEELFAEHFQAYPNVFEPTERGVGSASRREEAFHAYDQGNYVLASTLFEELLKEKKEPSILLLLGNAHLALGKAQEAQNDFLILIKDFDELEGQAKWYLSLSYLKLGDEEKAALILQELGDPQFTYSKKAKELLKNVK